MDTFFCKHMASPVGRLTLVAGTRGLVAVLWENDRPDRVRLPALTEDNEHPLLLETERQLTEYFAGTRTSFSLPLDLRGTPFQQQVWAVLQTIPFGRTLTYGEIAGQVGGPSASRAVGAANGRNPVSIIVPCHRVIGAGGGLTGFAGGLAAKEHLLRFESNTPTLF